MPGRVLVVEDEVLIRMLAVDMLEELGFAADEAGNAAEALQKLDGSGADYALIFLDIGLPDKKGDDLHQGDPGVQYRHSGADRERGERRPI